MQGDDGGSPVYSSSLTATTNHSVLQVTQISDHESIQEEKKNRNAFSQPEENYHSTFRKLQSLQKSRCRGAAQ